MRLLLASLLILSAIGTPQTLPPRNGAKQQEGSDHKANITDNAPKTSVSTTENQLSPAKKEQSAKEKAQCILKKAFAPETWPHWALFLAAIWAGVVALKTLKAIQREAVEAKIIAEAARDNATAAKDGAEAANKNAEFSRLNAEATRDNAAAAKASADALVNSERAWIMVDIRWHQNIAALTHNTGANEATSVNIDLLCTNQGKSPAWIVEEQIRAEVTTSLSDSPVLDPSDTQIQKRYEFVGVGQQCENPHRRLSGKGWNGKHVYVYGFIKYTDIFTAPPKEPRETWFGFAAYADGSLGRILSREYNRNT
jgi:hypothetical protein